MAGTSRHIQPTVEDLNLLIEISQMLTLLDRDRLLDRVVEVATKSFGAERATLLLNPDAPSDWQQILIRYRADDSSIEHMDPTQSVRFARRAWDKGLAGIVARERRGIIIQDTNEDTRWQKFENSTSAARSVLCVPFVLNNDMVIGVLTLQHSDAAQFDENDLALLTIIANQASVALSNAQLFHNLQQTESKLQGILSAMPDPIVVIDNSDHVIMANEGADSLRQQGVFLEVGKSIIDCIAPDSPFQQIVPLVKEARPLKETRTWEVHSQTARRDFQVQVSSWASRGQTNEGHAFVVRDITDLRDLNRFKDEMLHLASHDLRSPLALIVGYCSLIELDIEPDSLINDHIQAIYRATTRMQGLLDDLLRVEKIRTSALELMELLSVRELVESAAANVQTEFEAKNQSFTLVFEVEEDATVRGNKGLLREALENYLNNAQKYTPAGGSVRLAVRPSGQSLTITVEDTGIGIPEEAIQRVFEAFYRARQAGTEQVEGRGFGLHLVKTILERHGGSVWVTSEAGMGSVFGMELPRTQA